MSSSQDQFAQWWAGYWKNRTDTVQHTIARGIARDAWDQASKGRRPRHDDDLRAQDAHPDPVPDVTFDHPITVGGIPVEQRKPGPVSPDCRDGKCRACSGDAWDEDRDASTPCTHICHPVRQTSSAP